MDSDIIVSMQLFESHHDNVPLCAGELRYEWWHKNYYHRKWVSTVHI